MSKYDFDKMTDRSGIDSLKWDVKPGELPMWVADMDFEVCPDITATIAKRIKKPTFGYNVLPDSWYDAYISHWKAHGLDMDREGLMFSVGAVPSVSSMVRRLTMPAEKVLLQTPVYNIFFNSIINNGRYVIESPLIYSDGKYSVDFVDLERKLSDPQTRLMIVCNPHNPVGKIWERETLARVGELCKKHGVAVISDEIHCDITAPGASYVPFASVSDTCREISATCMAPSKAFNIAGLHTSAIYVPNTDMRRRIYRGINNDEIAEPNSFAAIAAVAAFEKGGEWLAEMNAYVAENRRISAEYIRERIPALTLVDADSTYLLWVDCRAVCPDSAEFTYFARATTGLFVTDGAEYGESGRGFFRMNIACPRERLMDGLARLCESVDKFVAQHPKNRT